MNEPAKPAVCIAMIDTPDGGRFYFLPPVPPDIYSPAIAVLRGVMRVVYVIPSTLGTGSIYSEGSERTCKIHRELLGIRAALQIMGKVWQGVLASHPGSYADIPKQKRLAECLTGSPEGAFAMIEKSGVLGGDGMPKCAADVVRNAMALAHWKAIWQLRKKGKGCMPDGSPKPGGLHWDAAAAVMNQVLRGAFPDMEIRQWNEFTGKTLKGLMDRHLLVPSAGV